MSSAIEILKNWKSKMANKVNIAFTSEEYNALSEALLALEQKEDYRKREIQLHEIINSYQTKEKKLKEWLEKEIEWRRNKFKVHFARDESSRLASEMGETAQLLGEVLDKIKEE